MDNTIEHALYAKAVKLLAGREHCVAELRAKLMREPRGGAKSKRRGSRRTSRAAVPQDLQCAGDSDGHGHELASHGDGARAPDRSEAVGRVIDRLVADGLLSDERFAESFVRARVSRGVGPVKIRADLRQRGIDDELAETFLTCSDSYWLEVARGARDKRFGPDNPGNRVEWAKRARFLAGRGFPSDVIYRLLGAQHG